MPKPFFASVVGYSSAVLSVAGLAAFCVVRIAYTLYYAHYGVSPDAIGLGFQALLAQEASAVNVVLLVAVIAILLRAGWLINGSETRVWRIDDEISKISADREFIIQSTASPASMDVEADKRALVRMERRIRDLEAGRSEAKGADKRVRRAGLRWLAVALTAFVVWAAVLIAEASVSSTGPRSAEWYDPLQVDVVHVTALTFDQGFAAGAKAADSGQALLFLGSDDNDFVLYSQASGKLLFIPDDSVEMATH